ncbi:PASTA domain-containing protein [Dactylosporangium sp. NPDC006015]|uniref:PASTA domain-containing protein n=1 Tax=Dactylosporangium sp. NPDC006015 TaxID=3154576 RepID=UPI0033B8CE40
MPGKTDSTKELPARTPIGQITVRSNAEYWSPAVTSGGRLGAHGQRHERALDHAAIGARHDTDRLSVRLWTMVIGRFREGTWMVRHGTWALAYMLGVAAVGLVGCGPKVGAGSVDQPVPIGTVTSSLPTQSTAAAQPTRTTPTSAAATTVAATTVVVPNGVGMNYQAAQDAWRAAGLHVSPAVDATGANRLPVIDSNWVVLAQDPPAGTQVQAGSFITATVKKYTDK